MTVLRKIGEERNCCSYHLVPLLYLIWQAEGKELFIRVVPDLNDEIASQLVEGCSTIAEVTLATIATPILLSLIFEYSAVGTLYCRCRRLMFPWLFDRGLNRSKRHY